MRITFILLFLLQVTLHVLGQQKPGTPEKSKEVSPRLMFAGDYPDPSILRDGSNYYIVHSSFEYYPGLLIWQSTDLVNWIPVTNALHKYVGSVWAPDLVKHKNKYYIYFPANNTNYVVTADRIEGPWTEPVDLKVGNIDPGHVADAEGQRYLYFSSGNYIALSDDGLSVKGELTKAYDGWPIPRDWRIECFCMEGPKIFKRGDYYYLTVAEGGTAGPATGHMVISARSKSPLGPWENSPFNPIIRTESNSERWFSKGHGTPFEDNHGNWWIVFHGYENGYHNMGRQTLLEPIEWTSDGWYKSSPRFPFARQAKSAEKSILKPVFNWNDDFKGSELKPQWKFFGEYDPGRYHLSGSGLTIKGKGNAVGNSSPLLTIPSNHSYIADAEMEIKGEAVGGLVLFYNNTAYSGILADKENVLANLRGWQFTAEKQAINRHVFLRLKNMQNTVDMFFSLDGTNWNKIESSLEVSAINHNALGGFLSLRIGLCATGEGEVEFKNFKYSPLD